MRLAALAIALVTMTTFAAATDSQTKAPVAVATKSQTKELWYEDCSRCHAPDGSGNCPLGKSLRVRDYSSPKAQSEFSDKDIEQLIRDGKVRNTKKVMPAYVLSPDEMRDMIQYIRSLVKP